MDQLRQIALDIVNNSYSVGLKYVKHKTFANFFTRFFIPRINNIIANEATQEDIKKVMWANKRLMDKAIKLIDTAEMINEGEDLGSPIIPDIGELAESKQFTRLDENAAMKLIEDLNL